MDIMLNRVWKVDDLTIRHPVNGVQAARPAPEG